jgi:hypothetical protein
VVDKEGETETETETPKRNTKPSPGRKSPNKILSFLVLPTVCLFAEITKLWQLF